jgi:hypothetical protein
MKLFHGTLSTRLPAIFNHGIKPRGAAASNWPGAAASRADAVYLTDAYPLSYALQAMWWEEAERERRAWDLHLKQRPRAWLVQADERKRRKLARELERQARAREREKGDTLPVIIEIDCGRLNPLHLIPDEDAVEQSLNYNGVLQQMAPGELLTLVRERTPQWAGQYELSLRTLGTCAHVGTIPASAITRVAVVSPAKAPELCHYARINPVTILNYRDVGGQLRWLTQWVFGDAPEYFDAPPESERAGIRIIEPQRLQGAAHAA